MPRSRRCSRTPKETRHARAIRVCQTRNVRAPHEDLRSGTFWQATSIGRRTELYAERPKDTSGPRNAAAQAASLLCCNAFVHPTRTVNGRSVCALLPAAVTPTLATHLPDINMRTLPT